MGREGKGRVVSGCCAPSTSQRPGEPPQLLRLCDGLKRSASRRKCEAPPREGHHLYLNKIETPWCLPPSIPPIPDAPITTFSVLPFTEVSQVAHHKHYIHVRFCFCVRCYPCFSIPSHFDLYFFSPPFSCSFFHYDRKHPSRGDFHDGHTDTLSLHFSAQFFSKNNHGEHTAVDI